MSDSFELRLDDLSGPEVAALVREHRHSVSKHAPPESVHALQLDDLRAPDVTLWSAWLGAALVGCGALKELTAVHGEIKSMRTSSAHLRTGVATAVLQHILDVAQTRGYRRVSLETGAAPAFAAARALYTRFGFELSGPFADYVDDPFSVFMTRELTSRR